MDVANIDFDASRNLIVNYLPPSFSQDDVRAVFQNVGGVKNCKLMRSYETGESLGYAFVEYDAAADAEKAIESLNGLQLDGKVIRVSHARKSSPETKGTNLYIAGLPDWVTEQKLHELFGPFGEIITLKVLDGKSGSAGRGIGFVRFSMKSDAERAIEHMAGKKLAESSIPLTVKFAVPPALKHHGSSLERIPINSPCDVQFKHTIQASSVVHQSKSIGNLSCISGSGHSSILAGEVHSVYVFGLLPTATQLTLYQLFSPFGGVMNVKIVQDLTKEDKPCKGFGFVNFCKYDEASHAVVAMNGYLFEGRTLQVSFKQQKGNYGGISLSKPISSTSNHQFPLHHPKLSTQDDASGRPLVSLYAAVHSDMPSRQHQLYGPQGIQHGYKAFINKGFHS